MKRLRRQVPAYSPVTARAVRDALAAVRRDRDAPRARLTAELQTTYDAPVVHLMHSGTAALEMAVRLARALAGGGPVALPALGCYDIATAAIGAGAPIALYDVDPHTLGPDLDSLGSLLLDGVRVVVVAPIAGIPVDLDGVRRCLATFGAVVVEDAAQCHGTLWRHHPFGSHGAFSVLSFGRGKGWTGGRGGALLVRDPVGLHLARELMLHEPGASQTIGAFMIAAAIVACAHPSRYAIPAALPWLKLGETPYHPPRPPARMSPFAAALLLATRDAAGVEGELRKANAQTILRALPTGTSVRPFTIPLDGEAGYLRLPLRVTGGWRALSGIRGAARLGVAPVYPTTLAALEPVRARLNGSGPWPGAEALVEELVTIPTHSMVLPQERQELIELAALWQREAGQRTAARPLHTAPRA